jgi:hypothetical protein
MNLIARLFMLLLATMLLLFAMAFISVVLLLSSLRWMLTGQKPSFVMYVQAYRRWKNMAAGGGQPFPRNDDIIDAEVREVSRKSALESPDKTRSSD